MDTLPDRPRLRVDEVANFFDVSPQAVYLWIQHGKLDVERTPGGSIRVIRDSVVRWSIRLDENRTGALS